MTARIKDTILKTLLNKDKNIKNLKKYEEVMAYLTTNEDEICNQVLIKAIETAQEKGKDIIDLLKDNNFCLDAAYEYVYFLAINAKVERMSK